MLIVLICLAVFLISCQLAYLLDPTNEVHRGTTGFLLAVNLYTLTGMLEKFSA